MSVSVAQLLAGHALVAELQLQGRQDRDQVGVAGALAVAVDRALHEPGAGADRGERVGDAAAGVVVGVDADPSPCAVLGDDRCGRLGDLVRQARAVGVAERQVLGPGLGGRAQALERVAGVVAPAVEEVLGVVDHPLARGAQEGDRLGDHRQVLLAARPS